MKNQIAKNGAEFIHINEKFIFNMLRNGDFAISCRGGGRIAIMMQPHGRFKTYKREHRKLLKSLGEIVYETTE